VCIDERERERKRERERERKRREIFVQAIQIEWNIDVYSAVTLYSHNIISNASAKE